ncbi:MAG: hypothetical protein JXP34_05605 [Planctomycetes bacterium]|nr:hypothetical protein [Planctomycetota bacterium]
MGEGKRVKILFVEMKARTYIWIQVVIIAAGLAAAVAFYTLARESDFWPLANAWWLCLLLVLGEALESVAVLAKARRAPDREGP